VVEDFEICGAGDLDIFLLDELAVLEPPCFGINSQPRSAFLVQTQNGGVDKELRRLGLREEQIQIENLTLPDDSRIRSK
jgi:hypothetical protein